MLQSYPPTPAVAESPPWGIWHAHLVVQTTQQTLVAREQVGARSWVWDMAVARAGTFNRTLARSLSVVLCQGTE